MVTQRKAMQREEAMQLLAKHRIGFAALIDEEAKAFWPDYRKDFH